MRNPIKVIKESTGMTIEKYCTSKLNTTYKSFSYRVSHGSLRFDEYKQILLDTGLTFEQVFGDEEIIPGQQPGRNSPGIEKSTDTLPDSPPPIDDEQEEPEDEYIDTFARFQGKQSTIDDDEI